VILVVPEGISTPTIKGFGDLTVDIGVAVIVIAPVPVNNISENLTDKELVYYEDINNSKGVKYIKPILDYKTEKEKNLKMYRKYII
jgi:hypothetical protein